MFCDAAEPQERPTELWELPVLPCARISEIGIKLPADMYQGNTYVYIGVINGCTAVHLNQADLNPSRLAQLSPHHFETYMEPAARSLRLPALVHTSMELPSPCQRPCVHVCTPEHTVSHRQCDTGCVQMRQSCCTVPAHRT